MLKLITMSRSTDQTDQPKSASPPKERVFARSRSWCRAAVPEQVLTNNDIAAMGLDHPMNGYLHAQASNKGMSSIVPLLLI